MSYAYIYINIGECADVLAMDRTYILNAPMEAGQNKDSNDVLELSAMARLHER